MLQTFVCPTHLSVTSSLVNEPLHSGSMAFHISPLPHPHLSVTLSLTGSLLSAVEDSEEGCEVHGRVYRDGEVFQPSCKLQCRCLDGGFTCVPLCQEDVRLPTPDCPYPRRVEIPGKCCPEWICDARDQHLRRDAVAGKMWDTPTLVTEDGPFIPAHKHHQEKAHCPFLCHAGHAVQHLPPNTPFSLISLHPAPGAASSLLSYLCQEWSTEWSACSVSCGVGFSTRVSNQNRYCRLETQRRLCMARPCPALPAAFPVVSERASVTLVPLGNRCDQKREMPANTSPTYLWAPYHSSSPVK